MSGSLTWTGELVGHRNWVTAIATTFEQSNLLITASRDKKLIAWELTDDET
eukprot:CAMPEP_0194483670 /NCGR_PEP_ID=MMETSP0253-20130528/5203_1 /TAXON_ID=2966 /ORGANISM="Noctiluca scintillans" /LENGTH=50 /DNA_ID=CAMNT_0039323349 /DNA_START=36 /DNA_END=185 /DNA_ORIENTATION=+